MNARITLILAGLLAFYSQLPVQRCIADDWATYQHDNAHTGRSSASFDPKTMQLAWGSTQYGQPTVVGNSLYGMTVSQGKWSLASFNLHTGQQNWSVLNKDGNFTSPPTYIEGLLVMATQPTSSNNSKLYVFDATTGAQKYTVDLPGIGVSIPTVARNADNQLVAYTSVGSRMTATVLGPSSGSLLWSSTFGGATFSTPTLVGNSVISVYSGSAYAFDQLTGEVKPFYKSDYSLGGGLTVAFDSTRSQFYIQEGSFLSAFSYLSNDSITQKWQTQRTGLESVAIGADGEVFSVRTSGISVHDPDDGHVVRSVSDLNLAVGYTPIISANSLFYYRDQSTGGDVTEVFDIKSLANIRTLPRGSGNSNSAFQSPGAVFDDGYVLYYRNGTHHNFDVYLAVPEPSTIALLFLCTSGLLLRRHAR